jgi:methionine-rich copper-binding protein CopC
MNKFLIKIFIIFLYQLFFYNNTVLANSTETISLPANFTGSAGSFQNIYSTATPITSDSANSSTDDYRVTFKVTGGGAIKLTTTTNLTAVTGYPSSDWTSGSATQISFLAADLDSANAAASSLQYQGAEGVLTASVLNTTTAGANASYNSTTGSYYIYRSTTITWTAARTAAADETLNGMTGYLATATTEDEFTFIKNTSSATQFWLGGTDAAVEGDWRWIDDPGVPADESGELFWQGASGGSAQNGYATFWNSGEPNDYGSGGEDALQVISNGKWNDLPINSNTLPYVVEFTPSASSGSLATLNISSATSPTISSLSPEDNGTNITLDANIIITFSEAVTAGSGYVKLYKVSDDTVVESFDVSSSSALSLSGSELTINPTSNLTAGTGYYVLVDSTAYDASDDSASFAGVSSSTTFNFTTAAEPTLSSSSPADNATGISLSANIELTFSEAVDVETGNITIKKTSDNSTVETIDVRGAKVTGSGTTTITVNPATTLTVSTEYYVLIDATAFDSTYSISYSGISSTTALSFTTLSDSTPPTMTITAAEGSDGFTSDDSTLSLTFTSSEATSNFAVGDITVSNGTLSDFNASSSTVYTATLTPTAAGEVTVDVAAATFTDAASNDNSAATQFNWTYGIDPTTKADVIGTVKSMSNSSINFTKTSIRSVRNRLDWLERNGSRNTSNQGIKVSFKNPMLNTILSNTKSSQYDFEKLVYNIPIKDEYSKLVYNPLTDYLFSELNTKINSTVKNKTNFKLANLNPQGKAIINNWSVWSEGQVFIGKVDATSTSSGQNSDSLNLAFGMDRPMKNREGLIGFSLNIGQDDIEIGSAGSDLNSDNLSLSYYNFIPTDKLFDFETQVGIGYMNIDNLRIDGDQRLNGKRDIWMPFGAVTLRNKTYQFENGTFTPYGRGEFAFIQLDPYSEQGGDFALSYNKQTIDRYMIFLGSDINFDITFKDGKLKPFGAVEYGLDLTSNSDVKMNYVGSSTVYQTQLEKLSTSNVMMKLGFDYEGKNQTNLAFSYERNEAIGAGHSNSIQIKFSKPLGKVN